MNLESSKTLGGVGAILILIGSLVSTYTFGVLDLIGIIMVFIALNGLATYYKENGIFTNAIYSLVTGIVGVVAAASAALYIVFDTTILTGFLKNIYPSWNGSWSNNFVIKQHDTKHFEHYRKRCRIYIGGSIFSAGGPMGFRYSCSLLRPTITKDTFIKNKRRFILNWSSTANHRRSSNNSYHRAYF